MPATAFTTKTSFQKINFGENVKTVFDIKMDVFCQNLLADPYDFFTQIAFFKFK